MLYVLVAVGLVISSWLGSHTWSDEQAAPRGDAPRTFGPRITLVRALSGFVGYLVPWLLFLAMDLAWAARFALGAWSWMDLGLAVGVVAFWPIQEWFIHAVLEHKKPFELFGKPVELVIARTHRAHHRNPWDPRYGVTTIHNLGVFFFTVPALWLLALEPPLATTGIATMLTLIFAYEWVHYLQHTSYVPRSRLYRRLWVNHRLHHFRNEQQWFGVTGLLGDDLLGTRPDPGSVEPSPACRALGIADDRPTWAVS